MEGNAVITAMTAAITTIATDCTNAIAAVVPVAAPIMGAIAVIGIAIKTLGKFGVHKN